MSDTNETTTTTNETTTSQEGGGAGGTTTQQQQTGNGQQAGAGAGNGERTFTQAEVNAIIADRVARVKQQGQQRTETTTKTSEGKLTVEQLAQRMDQKDAELAFHRAVTRAGLQLSERQERVLLTQFHSDKPERPGEWLTEVAADFGLGKGTSASSGSSAASSTATTTTDEKKTGTGSGAAGAAGSTSTAAGNRVNQLDSGALIDVSKLSPAELDQLGPQGTRKHLERVIAAGQERDGRPPVPAVLRKKG